MISLFRNCRGGVLSRYVSIVPMCLFLFGIFCVPAFSGIEQKNFSSPEEAVEAVIDSIQKNDKDVMLAILGPEGKDLIDSGDPVADRAGRSRFLQEYNEKHSLKRESADKAVLSVGDDDWPFPIPIVKKLDKWHLDTKAGKEEILNRRIGRNELNVIEAMKAYWAAQHEYASKNPSNEYAQKIVSTKSKKDGLYWETKEGEEESPLGSLIAKASKAGYSAKKDVKPAPYYGYYYKILTAQGKNAEGGAYDFIVNGKMILGFALVAYPAKYGNSGVMTFMINQQGIVYQKDLGKDTEKTVTDMTKYDPDRTWQKVD
ncbi:MAG: DUF2950 domain-containing protein [Nitrospirota bacterium]